jgi:hypothetical protein
MAESLFQPLGRAKLIISPMHRDSRRQ